MNAVTSSAPGKLLIAGEWSVLSGKPAIVAAVNRRVQVSVRTGDGSLPQQAPFAAQAAATLQEFLGTKAPYFLELSRAELYGSERSKLGLGSSAAETVATIHAMMQFLGRTRELSNRSLIFKLAALAHAQVQGVPGSGADLAACCYGGLLWYQPYDINWLAKQMQEKSVRELCEMNWPNLQMKPLRAASRFVLQVGWSGCPARSSELIKQFFRWKSSEETAWQELAERFEKSTKRFFSALSSGTRFSLQREVALQQQLFRELGARSGLPLVTPELEALCEAVAPFGLAAKPSGAGGGDCCICFVSSPAESEAVRAAWCRGGTSWLNLAISPHGVAEE